MSLRLFYQSAKKIKIENGRLFGAVIEEVFGEMPVTLSQDDLKVFVAINAVAPGEDAVQAIIDAIRKYGEIRVWWE